MKLRVSAAFGVLLSALFSARHAVAGDMYLQVFYGAAPVSGAEVTLNGLSIGVTDSQGALESVVDAGDHQVSLGAAGNELASFRFSLAEEENIDIKVDAGGTGEPNIELDTYIAGDANAATGVVTGTVSDNFGGPIKSAKIEVSGLGIEIETDSNGEFTLNVPRGIHFLTATHPTSGTTSDAEIRVVANAGVELNFVLREPMQFAEAPGLEIEESIVIASTYNPNPIDTISMEREAITVVDALDLAQIERFGDSTVASAVRRVAGVAVREGKYAMIRGLDGRYISSTINGIVMPSTDPLRRDLQLDLFPADILGAIEVQKGYTADQPGDATAGSLKISTRGLPDERVFKVSVSGGYRDGVTGEDTLNYEGDESDDFGFDDGFRALPEGYQALADAFANDAVADPNLTAEEIVALGQNLTNVYNVDTETAVPPFGLGIAYGDRFALDAGEAAFYGAASWGMDTEVRLDETIAGVNDFTTRDRVEKNYDFSAYLVAGWEGDSLKITSKTTFIRQTTDRTSRALNVDTDDDNREFETTLLEWTERQFISQQFEGEHFLLEGQHEINWTAGISESTRYQPDRRTYVYDNRPTVTSNDGLLLSGEVERRWSDLGDQGQAFTLDYKTSLDISDNLYTRIKLGGRYNKIERDHNLTRLVFEAGSASIVPRLVNVPFLTELDPETIFIGDFLAVLNNGEPDLFVEFRTEDTGNYDSVAETTGVYVQTDTEIGNYWNLALGVRYQEYRQSLAFPNNPSFTDAIDDLDVSNTLPVIALNYQPSDSWIFRLGYSQTLSYPGITERSPSITFDPDTDDPISGNPSLEVAEIDNLDFRVEYYFAANSSISAAIFHKQITKPIEQAPTDGVAGTNNLTYSNNQSVDLTGFELDANITLFDGLDWDGFIAGNLAFTRDALTLGERSRRLEAFDNRSLQGLSEVLANLQFGVDHIASGISGTLLVNYFDDRIDRAIRSSILGPVLEKGRVEVDLTFDWETDFGTAFSFKIGNVLDTDIKFEGTTTADNVYFNQSYRKGRTFSLGVSHSF